MPPKNEACIGFLKAIKNLGDCTRGLRTLFSTICVHSSRIEGRFVRLLHKSACAQKSRTRHFPFKFKYFDLNQGPCAQCFPQNVCKTQAVNKASFAAGAEPVFMVRQGWDYTSPGAFINAPASRPFALPLPIF
jgi:hypothetical protein